MNWFDNVSSDCDQPIAAACLMQGHWRHQRNPFTSPVLCRVVLDVAEPRVVAAQVIEHGMVEDLDSTELEDLTQVLVSQDVHHQARAWGFTACTRLPTWARPSFTESQIEELERIEGYLIDASDDTIDDVLQLRDEFLRGIGMTDQDVMRAARSPEQAPCGRKGGRLVN
jgi:stage V sporulation protein SpoVS